MLSRFSVVALMHAPLAMLSGCATVNPRPDYEQATKRITQATGQDNIYQPGDEEVLIQKVEELLSDGITASEAEPVRTCCAGGLDLSAEYSNPPGGFLEYRHVESRCGSVRIQRAFLLRSDEDAKSCGPLRKDSAESDCESKPAWKIGVVSDGNTPEVRVRSRPLGRGT